MNPMSTANRAGVAGAWTAAAIVIAISLLSTFTLSDDDNDGQNVAANSGGGTGGFVLDDGTGFDEGPDELGADVVDGTGGGSTGGRTRRSGSGSGTQSGTQARSTATTTPGGGGGTGPGGGGTGPGGGGGTAGPAGSADCAKGQNAGNSDVGVSSKQVAFAATVVKTGIAKDFLSDAQFGMEAVIQKVKREGGICGRLITVKYDDDGWNPSTGQQIIARYIGEKKYFGLAVNPSSEGLRLPIENGDIKNNGFPVIGADGMLIGQYKDPWVWPVATSTHSVMHIMARHAIETLGAKKLGIVWEGNYRFGKEGFRAFDRLAKELGATVHNTEIQGGKSSYSSEANSFIGKCGGTKFTECDFVAMLLEPATASQWVLSGGLGNGTDRPAKGIGAPQPLFIDSFAKNCQRFCANMLAWTGFKPPLFPFNSEPAVQTYLKDLRAVSSSADANNPHVEGAYVGMNLVAETLKKLGAAPTRAGAKQVLDSMTLETGLGPAIKFTADNHFSAVCAQPFEAIYNGNTFTAWRFKGPDFFCDGDVEKHQTD